MAGFSTEMTMISHTTDEGNLRFDYEFGPGRWFVKDYFLYMQVAWTTLVIHVGDLKCDEAQPMKLTIELPLEKS